MIKWRFPSNDHGENKGINDSGVATFRGTPLRSLAREICQNSLDAARGKTVTVEFNMFSLSTDSKKIVSAIRGKKYKMICINDSSAEFDFDRESSIIIEAFDKLLPQKSSYEK